jgi:hypothetical protein
VNSDIVLYPAILPFSFFLRDLRSYDLMGCKNGIVRGIVAVYNTSNPTLTRDFRRDTDTISLAVGVGTCVVGSSGLFSEYWQLKLFRIKKGIVSNVLGRIKSLPRAAISGPPSTSGFRSRSDALYDEGDQDDQHNLRLAGTTSQRLVQRSLHPDPSATRR